MFLGDDNAKVETCFINNPDQLNGLVHDLRQRKGLQKKKQKKNKKKKQKKKNNIFTNTWIKLKTISNQRTTCNETDNLKEANQPILI